MNDSDILRILQQHERELQSLHRRIDLLEMEFKQEPKHESDSQPIREIHQPADNQTTGKFVESSIPPENLGLYETLKEWRLNIAHEKGVPAFVVLYNKTLAEIAAVRPTTREQLDDISGFGPQKLDEFADAIIEIVERTY